MWICVSSGEIRCGDRRQDLLLAGRSRRARDLVAGNPALAAALARLHRAYAESRNERDAYADRLRTDPLLREMLHQVLSGITAVRSGAEILADVPDIGEDDRRRFVNSIGSEARMLTGVARNLLGHFESEAAVRRAGSPARELDDLIFENDNYFAGLEAVAANLRREIEAFGPFGEAALVEALARRFAVTVGRSGERQRDAFGFPGQYRYDAETRTMWFEGSAIAATRQFQLARLYAELAAGDAIAREIDTPLLTGEAARRLAFRALGSYLAAAVVLPYERFLADAEVLHYDIEALRQTYMASFEQVAHRLATLRRPDARGIAFGFLRSDPSGRLTKHFPLPGLLLPTSGHACPLWVIYEAFRQPEDRDRAAHQRKFLRRAVAAIAADAPFRLMLRRIELAHVGAEIVEQAVQHRLQFLHRTAADTDEEIIAADMAEKLLLADEMAAKQCSKQRDREIALDPRRLVTTHSASPIASARSSDRRDRTRS